jgi:GTP-binding protein
LKKLATTFINTLYPNLGVVKLGQQRSFVIADIPGLVEGAAEGAGLGIQFLKHLARTGLLLHIVDVNPMDGSDPVKNINIIQEECVKYGGELTDKETWLVLNKIDTLTAEEYEARCKAIVKKSHWQGPVYRVCALSGEGTEQLCQAIMQHIEQTRRSEKDIDQSHLDSELNDE